MTVSPAHHVYDEFVDFIVDRISLEEILAFKASPAAQKRTELLMERLKADEITPEENDELERIAQFDLLVGRLKARAAAELSRK